MPIRRRQAHRENEYATRDLPQCEGPKLHPFYARNYHIEWLERLDSHDSDDIHGNSEYGGDGYVFKVKIESHLYALKVFKFYNALRDLYFWGPALGNEFPPQEVALQRDPFYAECRAYGQLQQEWEIDSNNRLLAVPSYGYILLSFKDKQMLLKKEGIDLEEDCLDGLSPRRTPSKRPVRAIVKKLASPNKDVNEHTLPQILKDIKQLNKLGIYNMDIRKDNFRDGLLVDFGQSWTEPYLILDAFQPSMARRWKNHDLMMFDDMIEGEGFETDIRAIRKKKVKGKG